MRYILIFLLFVNFAFSDAHIFIYHRFDDARHKSTSINLKNLREQFEYFKKNDYKVIPLKTLVSALENGEKIDDKWVVLVIDDGYKSFYTKAYEIFKEYNYPFTMFVYIEATDKKYGDFMSFDELREIAKFGELGYHSYAHSHMTKLNDEALKRDFDRGIEIFKREFGYHPEYFSYPYGEYNDRVKNISKQYNFKAIFNQNSGAVSQDSDILDLDRIPLMDGTNLRAALATKFLKADFVEPKFYPNGQILDRVEIKTDLNSTHAHLYISTLGSKKVEVKNGLISEKIGKKIPNKARIVIGKGPKVNTKILVKDEHVK